MSSYEDLFSLKGRRVLISGGTSGLGKAMASAFIGKGAYVAVCGTKPEKARPLEEAARVAGTPFLALGCDVTRPEQVSRLTDQLEARFGYVDILINSAGANRLLPAADYDDETFRKVMDLNLNGLHTLTREIGKRFMIPRNYGRILNISSVKSLIGATENYIAYCASKGAVNMYTRQLACEWGKYHITCNAIAPTFVRTPINSFQLDDPQFYNALTKRIPLGRIGREEDIACAALYLCSDAAAFVSGKVLCVDGGLTAMQ